jgi:hypothetical protein
MKTITVIFAQRVPHYGSVEISTLNLSESSALAGHLTSNPIRLEAICDYTKMRDETAALDIETGQLEKCELA